MSLKGGYLYIFLSAIISILAINLKNYYLYFFIVLLLIIAFKKYDKTLSLIIIITTLFFTIYRRNEKPIINDYYIKSDLTIKNVNKKYLIVENNNIKYLIYLSEYDENIYNETSIIHVEGTINEIEKDLELDTFEFATYLKNKRVFYEIKTNKQILIIDDKVKTSTKIINFLTKKLENESYSMVKMLLFNDKTTNIDVYNNLKEINALHLFVVSGFHISFLCSLINIIFKKSQKISNIISLVFTLLYIFILDFSISSFRAFITFFITNFFKDKFNKIDSLSISGIAILLLEPLNIFNYSFIMTFIMTFTIIFANNSLKIENKIIKNFLVSLFCFLSMIPIQLIINYKINIISLFTNIILTYIVTVLFVLCIFSILISFIDGNAFSFIYKCFNTLIEKISLIKTSIVLGSIPLIAILLFYSILIILFVAMEKENKKLISITACLFSLFFICLYNRHLFNYSQQVIFLNVYQGDCCIIMDSFNGKVLLIDTGGLTNYDIASKKIMPFLNYHGIRKIDKIVITHDDYDHCGALDSLKEQIKIDEVITDKNITQVDLGKITLHNLNKYTATNNNDSSIVLYGKICDYNFLFTGDISSKIENEIIKDNVLKVDFLKVAHHGSNTSTSNEFLKAIKPTYAIISVGKNNKYKHPSINTIERLNDNNVIIYRIDINGSIRIKKKLFQSYFIECAK